MSETVFRILQATLSSPKFLNKDDTLDLTNRIVELQLYEDIYKPFVSGKIAILDDLDLINALKFRGTEKITIVLGRDEDDERAFSKTFYMYQLESINKENERRQLLTISLIEPHFYHSSLKKISKSYTGTIEQTVQKICSDELAKECDFIANRTYQGSIKVLIPYLNPLEACNWLIDRASTETGSPYFLYGSCFSDRLFIKDLESMILPPAVNAKTLPYQANQVMRNESGSPLDVDNLAFQIKEFNFKNIHNNLNMIRNGAIGSKISNTDLSSGTIQSTKFTIASLLNKYKEKGIIKNYQNVYEEFNRIDIGEKSNLDYLFDSQNFHTINSQGVYENQKGYYDDVDDLGLIKRVQSQALRHAIEKNTIDIFVPGAFLFVNQVSVGQKIKTRFLKTLVYNEDPNQFDDDRSGDYLILQAKHVFNNNEMKSGLTVGKLENNTERVDNNA